MLRQSRRQILFSILITLLFSTVPTLAADGLVLHMRFDQGTSNNGVATDLSGQGNDGLVTGDPQVVEGVLGDALEFDGADDVIEVPLQPSITFEQGDSFSVMAWVKTSVHPSLNDGIVGNYRVSTTPFWALLVNDTAGGVTLYVRDVGGTLSRLDSPDPIDTDMWMHVAGVRDQQNEEVYLYVDGEVVASMSDQTENINSGQSIWIGDHLNRFYDGLMDDVRIYNSALGQAAIQQAMKGTSELASAPNPENEAADVPRDVILTWEPGEFAAKHNVYLGDDFDDVNNAAADSALLIGQGLTTPSYEAGILDFGQTYYWRVDEVNGAPDNTIFKGEVWSFTVEPLAYPIAHVTATSSVASLPGADPENMVNGSGLNENDEHSTESFDMWQVAPTGDDPLTIEYAFDAVYKLHDMLIWNYNVQFELMLGFGVKDATIEYSENGADWVVLGDVVFNQATAQATYAANTTVDFGGLPAQYVKLTVNSGWGTLPVPQYGLSEVRFLHIPVQGREPQPADGAVDVAADADLSWRAGREAVSHEAYLSTDPNALELIETTSTTSVDPGDLDLGATYYWRIDEVNEAEAISTWAGAVWGFTTQQFLVVDDFESYTDDIDAGEAIFLTWIDGYEMPGNGSTVGNLEAPFAEQTIVNSGNQSMPLFYDNAGAGMSEAELALAQNWTTSGVKSLSLSFQGAAGNTGQLYVKINGTKVAYDGDAGDIARAAWQPWNIDLSAVGGNMSNVTSLAIGIDGASAAGVIYIDDVRLYPKTPEYITPADPGDEGLVAYYAFEGNANDHSGNGNHGTLNGDVQFAAGHDGSALDCDGVDDYVSTGKSASDLGIGGNSPRTVGSWVFTRSFNNGGIYDVGNRVTAQDFSLRTLDTENSWRVQYWGGDSDFSYNTANEWVQFTHVHDGAYTKIYANGVLIVDWEKTIDTTDDNPFQIGLYGWPGDFFNGLIDEVHLYNRALSAGEALGLSGQTTPRHKEL